jgi:hypothetical protein
MGLDPVAVDLVGMQILEAKRAEVAGAAAPLSPSPLTWLQAACATWKLGQADPEKVTVVKQVIEGRQ